MQKISDFYLELATNAEKMAMFNHGETKQQIADSRQTMLSTAGFNSSEDIISLSQDELRKVMAKALEEENSNWSGISNNSGNTQNTNNTVGFISSSKAH